MRCFVAMAFGSADSDAVFDKFIGPAVKNCCGTAARRVDRVEHNDEIDNQIIAELDAADLVIADLTYARPSVYYEAGYAQRNIPVIYTVRRDHFRDNPANDPLGNLRVHFDLKMKNIIDWRNPDDVNFGRRLERRIRFVTKPLLARKRADAAQAAAVSSFGRLALSTRLQKMLSTGLDALESLGYYEESGTSESGARFGRLVRIRKTVLDTARVKIVNAVLKSDLQGAARIYSRPWCNLNVGESRPKRINELVVVCSLAKVNHRSVAAVLRDYEFDETDLTFSRDTIYSLPGANLFKPGIKVVYRNQLGSSSFIISQRGRETEELTFSDGYFGKSGTDSRGRHRFIRRSKETVVPVRRTFVFLDRVREVETLGARIIRIVRSLERGEGRATH